MGILTDYADGLIPAEQYLAAGGNPHAPMLGMDVLTVAIMDGPYQRQNDDIKALLQHPDADLYRQSDPNYPERNAAYWYTHRLEAAIIASPGKGRNAIRLLPAMLRHGYRTDDVMKALKRARRYRAPTASNYLWVQSFVLDQGISLPKGWTLKQGEKP